MPDVNPVPKPTRTPRERGRASKRKGYRVEKAVAADLGGERVPLSGSLGGRLSGDVTDCIGQQVEVKSRRDGFALLYRWLCIVPNTGVEDYRHTPAVEAGRKQAPDYLVIGADNSPRLVVVPMRTWQRVLGEIEGRRQG